MTRSPFRVEDIDDDEDLDDIDDEDDTLGLDEDDDDFENDPDPEADLQGLIEMRPEDTVEYLRLAALQAGSFLQSGRVVMPLGEMTCRVCGCSDERACAGGCVWAAPNLCSRCVA